MRIDTLAFSAEIPVVFGVINRNPYKFKSNKNDVKMTRHKSIYSTQVGGLNCPKKFSS